MAAVPVIATVTLLPGKQDFPAIAIDKGMSLVTAVIDRATMASASLQIDWSLELSLDGGVTWVFWGGAGTKGGLLLSPKALPVTESTLSVELPQPDNPDRQIRGQVTVDEAVTTALTLRFA